MSSRASDLPDFPEPTAEEAAVLKRLNENPPRLTWDEYVRAVNHLNAMYPPYREIRDWLEPFEL